MTSFVRVGLLAALFTLFLPSFAYAQANGRIAGTVLSADTGETIPGANVELVGTTFGAAADELGRFEIAGLPAAPHVLRVSTIGYETSEFKVNVGANETATVRIPLEPAVLEIPELIVERESMLAHPLGMEGIPGSAHRVTARSLEKFEANDVNRALRGVPGMNLQEEDGYGLRPNIGIRGSGAERSSKISIMEDGILVAPAPYAASAAYYFPTIGRMEEIEIRKGSSQIKYGPYTTGGAINLLSKSIPEKFKGEARVQAGEEESLTLEGFVGNSWKYGGFLVQGFNAQTNGYKELDSGGETGFDKTDIMFKGRVNTEKNAAVYQALSVKALFTDEVSDETYLGLTDADFRSNPIRRYAGSAQDQMNTEYRQVMMRHLIVPNEKLKITTTAYRSTFARNWYKLDKVGGISIANLLENPTAHAQEFSVMQGTSTNPDTELGVKANNREYLSRGIQATAQFSTETTAGQFDVELGARIHEDEMDRFQWVDGFQMTDSGMNLVNPGTPGTESNRIETGTSNAFFVQPRLITGRVTIQPGLRYEDITIRREDYGKADPGRTGANLTERENNVDVWIPGLGVSAEIWPDATLFGGVHRGFAPPGSKEGTNPEKSVNYEIGVRYQEGARRAEVAFFYNDFANLLGTDLAAGGGSGSGDLFNGGEATVRGLEITARENLGRLMDWRLSIPVGVSYTFTDATFESSFASDFANWGEVEVGDELPYVPRNQFTVDVGLNAGHFDLALQGSWVDDMRTIAGQGDLVPEESVGSFFVAEASVGYEVYRNVRIFSIVKNLFNKEYAVARRPAGLRPGLPRTLLAGVRFAF
ncbi:MAG: TonB-dependent receptor [Rhodothermales bacterium]